MIIIIVISILIHSFLRNLWACGVLLPPWVVPLWSVDGPERFLLFQICAFTVFFLQKNRVTGPVANGNEMIQLLKNVSHTILYNCLCIPCHKIQCFYNSMYILGHLKLILSLLNFLNLFFFPFTCFLFFEDILIGGGGRGGDHI